MRIVGLASLVIDFCRREEMFRLVAPELSLLKRRNFGLVAPDVEQIIMT